MIMVTSGQERCQRWLVITIDTQTFTTTKTPSQNCYYFGKGPYKDSEGYSKRCKQTQDTKHPYL